MTDIYIDDLISITVGVKGMHNLVRCDRAPLFGINTLLCPLDPEEPIPRKTIESMNTLKLEALLQAIDPWMENQFLPTLDQTAQQQVHCMGRCNQNIVGGRNVNH